MLILISGFFCSLVTVFILIRFFNEDRHFAKDRPWVRPQQIHTDPIPRIGGLGVFIGLCLASLVAALQSFENGFLLLIVVASSIPVIAIGTLEDINQNLGSLIRLAVICIGAFIAIYFLNASITNLDIRFLGGVLALPIISVLFTCFAIAGLTNAYNLIDGLNGLASMVGIISLMAITYVAFRVGDRSMVILPVALIGSIAGFFVWNYPRGQIFLGDGGAYLIGFCIAIFSILIINRNPQISPWFALIINAFPIFETLFSIWRRQIQQRRSALVRDTMHLHSVIYRKLLKQKHKSGGNLNLNEAHLLVSRKASIYLWLLSSAPTLIGILWWDLTWVLELSFVIFCFSYCWIYKYFINCSKPFFVKN
jgi:UDP-N-acetylmuramyl pentapeptide phosphotransferase/UDP-N-acetylglucosamine-1-phosphate transferase